MKKETKLLNFHNAETLAEMSALLRYYMKHGNDDYDSDDGVIGQPVTGPHGMVYMRAGEAPSFSGISVEHLNLAIIKTVEICDKGPHLNINDVPTEAYALLKFCLNDGKAPGKDAEPPCIQKRFRDAFQAREEILLLAKKSGKVFDGDEQEIWRYGKENLDAEIYIMPPFQTWQNYINGYTREAEKLAEALKAEAKTE